MELVLYLVELDVEDVVGKVAPPELGGAAVPACAQTLFGVAETACQQPRVAEHRAMIVRPRHHHLLRRAVRLHTPTSRHNKSVLCRSDQEVEDGPGPKITPKGYWQSAV